MTDKKVKIIIDKYINIKKDIKTDISQKLFVLPIQFIIHINGIFNTIIAPILEIIFFSFINNMKFLANKNSI